ncbi:MAG: hypothetical protein K6T90_09840 [Leptolyngbyaceae cyanobacterium HOT.MB2.61]|jgi:hypothetical protein|nr:hypothetical protein [Leptolyngbyaceae cyanobacterium HOT.MB2.61]
MKREFWIAYLGVAALLASCSEVPSNQQMQAPATQSADSTAPSSPQSAQAQSFPDLIASPAAVVEVPAVPGLLKPTNPQKRVPQIVTGRQNPFEAVPTAPIAIPVSARKTQSTVRSLPSLPPKPFSPPPLSTVPVNSNPGTLPPLTVSANSNLTPLPPIGVPAAPPSRSNLAEAIEVTGVLQIKGKWNVIVKEPGSPTSRYVKAGDYLANGRVLVKRILAGAEPVVVLQQNGIEVIKSLGSSGGPIAS